MDKSWKIGLLIATILVILSSIVYYFTQNHVLETKGFWSAYFPILLLAMIIVGGIVLYWILNKEEKKEKKFPEIFKSINDLLMKMPEHDYFIWDAGETTRYTTKIFPSYEYRKYWGIVGNTKNGKRIVVIYGETEDDMVKFIGDPSPKHELDPLYKFNPLFRDPTQLYAELLKAKQSGPGTKIDLNLGKSGQEDVASQPVNMDGSKK